MTNIPSGLKYSKDHEWAKAEGNLAFVGITDYAQDQLGDVVYVELPPAGREIKIGEEFGVVESVKSVSSLYAPVSGKVVEANPALNDSPQLVNDDPYGRAWMIKVEMSNPADLDALLSAESYQKTIESK